MAAPITYTPVGDLLIDQLVEPPPQPGQFRRGLKTGVADLKSIGGGVLQYAGRGLGAKPLEDYGAGVVESAAAEAAPYRMQVEDVGAAFDQGVGPGLGAAADLVKYTVGNQLPMLATTVAGGVGGRLAAGALGATRAAAGVSAAEKAAAVAKTAAGVATPGEAAIASAVKAADLGTGLGLGASAVGMELGQIAPEGLKPENNASMLQMATGALAAGALDTMIPVYLARQMGLMGAAQRALTPRAAGIGAVAKDVGVGAARVGAFEAGQETAQSAIERASANQPLSGPEAGSDYLNSGVMGAIMGVLTGGIAGGVNSMQRPVAGAEPVVAPPTEPAAPAGLVEPAPAPPTPEAMHADLVAQHAAATEQLTSLGQAVTQAQQQHDALVAARAQLDNESKLEPGQRRTKSELTVAKRAATAQIKAARAQIEELGGQVFAARNAVDALTPQIEVAQQAKTKSVVIEAALAAARPWDQENRTRRGDEWFNGAKADQAAISGFNDALAAGGASLQAHGMGKERTLQGGIQNLLGMLTNGLDAARGGGVLQTAPLVSRPGEGLVGATASGSAYSDGPFMLIARNGEQLSGNLSGLGAVLVNQAHAGITQQIADAIHAIRPDVIVAPYSEAGAVARSMQGVQTSESTPLTFPTIDYPGTPTPYERTGTVPDLVQPEIAARAAPLGSDTIADPNLPAPAEAEQVDRAVKGVHALFREQRMPLTTTEESLATPPLTRREVALARVEQRAPREAVKNEAAAQMAAVEENAMAVIEPLAATMAATKTKTPKGQAKVAAKFAKAMRGVVQEAAKTGSIEAAQQYVTKNLPTALKGLGVTADAVDMAKAVNAGVGLARTQFSKGATEDYAANLAFYLQEKTGSVLGKWRGKMSASEQRKLFGRFIGKGDIIIDGQMETVANRVRVAFGQDYDDRNVTSWRDLNLPTQAPSESRAALTQDEFEALSPAAKTAALDAYTQAMRAKGTALLARLLGLIGDRPELTVSTFAASPGGHIGSYTRVGPLKAVISMATNAKEGLSVADHEGYHFAEDWLLTGGEKKVVANALRDGKPLFEQLKQRLRQYDRENGTSLTDEVMAIPAEARAYAFEFWRRGEFKADGALARAWQKIKQFFERVANAVNGLGFQSIEDVFVALASGQMAEREMVAPEGRAAYESRARGNSWYYSALTDAVAAMPTRQASAQGWRDQIKGLVARGAVKQVELDAVGLNDWLDLMGSQNVAQLPIAGRLFGADGAALSDAEKRGVVSAVAKFSGKITKDQVMAFLGEHGVQVQEVMLGERSSLRIETDGQGEFNVIDNVTEEILSVGNSYPQAEAYLERHNDKYTADIKFSGYQLPGGTNYRELLLTLPDARLDEYERIMSKRAGGRVLTQDEVDILRNPPDVNNEFRSSHFDQPNILAHVRFNERVDAGGRRVLFLEELQSDWAQKGRKEGFTSAVASDPRIPELRQLQEKVHSGRATDVERAQFNDLWDAVYEQYGIPNNAALSDVLKPGVPSAPFVTKTEAWTALALKRMIRYAAENGFDRVAWTTGEQQAARYDLSKQVDAIHIQINDDGTRTVGVDAHGNAKYINMDVSPDGRVAFADSQPELNGKRLDDVIGKEAADKVMSASSDKTLSGLDLKVGGEGMKGYYDKIVPSVANEILRKLGGGKVGEVSVGLNTPTTTPGMTRIVRDDDGTYAVEVRKFDEDGESFWELAAFGLTKEDAEARRLFGGQVPSMQQPGFDITPRLAEAAANGLPLFSRAAAEMHNRMAAGELEAVQIGEQYARLVENAKAPSDLLTRLLGVAKDDIVGGIGRWWTNNVSTPNFISASSRGFKNVYQAFNTYSRYRKILGEQLVRERVPDWYRASDADRKAAFDVMLTRTLEKYSTSSQELADLLNTLTPAQRKLYDQATGMIAAVLRRQFDSQKETRRRQLGAEAYEKWLASRQEQMTALLDQGYVPLRRYGDYSVEVYMEAPDGKRVKAGLEFFNSPSQAKTAALAYAKEIERSGVALKVEMGRRSKNERDTGVSLEQFLGTLRRQGIDISQAERERLVVAMTNADSLVRTQMMRREGLAGFSRDSMRVLHEFGVNTTSEIAYARFAPVLDAALDGAEVAADIDAVTSEPVITVGESFGRREDGVPHNLWEQDGPMSGFYRDRANAMADTTLVPDRQSEWATKMRTAGVMYFIGGSISGAAVNTLSIPMVLTPYLSTHTDYLNATMTSLKTWKDSWQHYNVLRDMDKMKNPDPETAARLDAAGIGKEMRAAIVAAADHIFDTEIHMMLGISQGSLYSRSRNVQRAAEVWMTPFRVAEQTNRLASFMAAYRIATTGGGVRQADGTFKKLSGQELFRFASETVDQTQNNYNVNNRPGIMNNPLGALMFQFKSFPLFIIEAAALMYKVSPKSAVYMLLGLTAMAGVQGLPFAEEILNLVDVISQQLFNSPFNSRRAMRNAIKSASDAIGAADLSDAVMRGLVNEVTGVGVATRVSSGFIPGTRIGAADADKGRVLAEIAGAPFSMLHDALSNAGPLVSAAAGGDWRRAADALRAGGPIAARNLVKGAEQLSTGYASDSRGRKVVDVSTVDGILQLTGLSSAAVTKANDMESIIIQTKAFHTQVSQDLEARLVKAYRADDAEQVARILDLRAKWNAQNPMMPILSNPAATRRAIMLAGMPLNRREQILLGRRLGAEFADVTAQ